MTPFFNDLILELRIHRHEATIVLQILVDNSNCRTSLEDESLDTVILGWQQAELSSTQHQRAHMSDLLYHSKFSPHPWQATASAIDISIVLLMVLVQNKVES